MPLAAPIGVRTERCVNYCYPKRNGLTGRMKKAFAAMVMDMVKYRVVVDGRIRGQYETGELRARFSSREIQDGWGEDPTVSSSAYDINAYISRAGSCITLMNRYRGERLCFLGTYHYAGATIVVDYTFLHKPLDEDAGELSVKLVSNDPMDDVVDQLCRRFSYLRNDTDIAV